MLAGVRWAVYELAKGNILGASDLPELYRVRLSALRSLSSFVDGVFLLLPEAFRDERISCMDMSDHPKMGFRDRVLLAGKHRLLHSNDGFGFYPGNRKLTTSNLSQTNRGKHHLNFTFLR